MERPPLHPQVAAMIVAEGHDQPTEDVAALRRAHVEVAESFGGTREEVGAVEELEVAGRSARLYAPLTGAAEPGGLLVWLHGGGWIMGDLEGFDHVCRSLANASGHRVLSLDYRLAPEHPFPAGLQDALAAVAWATGPGAGEHGWDAARVAVGGDSAGGNLAAVVARHHATALRAQLLVYPALDAAANSPSYAEQADMPLLTAAAMRRSWSIYLDGHEPTDPDASPARAADLRELPAATVVVAGHDVLRDEGLAYAAALEAAGVPVEVTEFADMGHAFLRWGGVADRAGELLLLLGDATRRALA